MKKVLLYSGGMDSWLIRELWKPDECVYIDAGTKYGHREMNRLPSSVEIEKCGIGKWERKDKIIPMRNLYFIMTICNMFPEGDLQIALGATAGDRVLDKSDEFAEKASDLLSFLYQKQWWCEGRKIEVVLPYKKYTKEMLLEEYKNGGGDLKKAFATSFSCYEPDEYGLECWKCKPCIRKMIAFWSVGYRGMSVQALKSVWQSVHNNIIPEIDKGTYGRGAREEQTIMEFDRAVAELLRDWKQVENSFEYGEIADKIAWFKERWGNELVLKC